MGNNASSLSPETSQHVFSADTPVRFSNELVESLQNSVESDTTRSKHLELKIQQRINSELEKLSAAEGSRLAALQDQLSAAADSSDSQPSSSSSSSSSGGDSDPQSAASALAERVGDAFAGPEALERKARHASMSRSGVAEEVEALRRKLADRRRPEAADPGVEAAQKEVVACLRARDRRPLDCWKEVEAFRKEVGRLERGFVERTVR